MDLIANFVCWTQICNCLLLTSYVVANYSHRRVLNVLRYQAVELFLASCVPNLHSNHLIINVYGFREEINPDSSLNFKAIRSLLKAKNLPFTYCRKCLMKIEVLLMSSQLIDRQERLSCALRTSNYSHSF